MAFSRDVRVSLEQWDSTLTWMRLLRLVRQEFGPVHLWLIDRVRIVHPNSFVPPARRVFYARDGKFIETLRDDTGGPMPAHLAADRLQNYIDDISRRNPGLSLVSVGVLNYQPVR